MQPLSIILTVLVIVIITNIVSIHHDSSLLSLPTINHSKPNNAFFSAPLFYLNKLHCHYFSALTSPYNHNLFTLGSSFCSQSSSSLIRLMQNVHLHLNLVVVVSVYFPAINMPEKDINFVELPIKMFVVFMWDWRRVECLWKSRSCSLQ